MIPSYSTRFVSPVKSSLISKTKIVSTKVPRYEEPVFIIYIVIRFERKIIEIELATIQTF